MTLAGVFLAGTSFGLFNDILFDGARLTTGHVLTALALLAATAAGHQIVSAWRARRLALMAGLVMLTTASLAYVATMSGARNAEQSALKAERIGGSNAQRAEIVAERARAQAMLDQSRTDIARECASGEGSRCVDADATMSQPMLFLPIARLKRALTVNSAASKLQTSSASAMWRASASEPMSVARGRQMSGTHNPSRAPPRDGRTIGPYSTA